LGELQRDQLIVVAVGGLLEIHSPMGFQASPLRVGGAAALVVGNRGDCCCSCQLEQTMFVTFLEERVCEWFFFLGKKKMKMKTL